MTTNSTTCHNCDSEMEPSSGYYAFSCPGCEHISDPDGVQRRYSTGTPCPCELCRERLDAQARLAQTPPFLKLLGQAFVALALARASAEAKRRAH